MTDLPSRTDTERPAPGQRFAGRYRIEAVLGRGGMGEVYRALDEEVGDELALKLLSLPDADALERFRREVRLARRIAHPNVARMFDLGTHGTARYLTMELVRGSDLRKLLRARGALSTEKAVTIARQIAEGLSAAHAAGVVHRDLKPSNVLIEKESGRVVVSDFGISRALAGDDSSLTSGVIGTPAYMAPEQLSRAADERSDLYALGVILYEMLAGQRPRWGAVGDEELVLRLTMPPPDLRDSVRGVPARLAELVSALLRASPSERPASAREVALALAQDGAAATARLETARTSSSEQPSLRSSCSLVVLPFSARGSESADLGDILAEELTDVLARVAGLRVLASRSARSIGDEAPEAIGRRLGVEVVVCGAVQRRSAAVRATVRMVNSRDGVQLWTRKFDGTIDDLFGFEEMMAQKIAEALRLELNLTSERGRIDPRAIELYMSGRRLIRTFFGGAESAVESLRAARELAPNCRPIAAAFATACIRSCYAAPERGKERIEEASRAIEPVDEVADLPEVWFAAAMIAAQIGDYRTTVRWLGRVLAAAPTHSEAQEYLGRLQCQAGNFDEGIQRLELAAELDPDHFMAMEGLLVHQALRGRLEQAEHWLDKLRKAGAAPARSLLCGTEIRLAAWRGDRARVAEIWPLFREYAPKAAGLSALTEVYGSNKSRNELERMIQDDLGTITNPRFLTFIDGLLTEALMYRGEIELAKLRLQSAAERTLIDLDWLERCPLLDALRGSNDFESIRRIVTERANAIWAI